MPRRISRADFNPKRALRLFLWIGGGLAILAGLIYLTLNFAPQRLAVLLPDAWSKRVGEQMEASLVEKAKVCQTSGGRQGHCGDAGKSCGGQSGYAAAARSHL